AFSGSAAAQAVKVDVEKPTFDDLQSPSEFGGTKSKNFKPKDWLEVEAKMKVQMSPEPPSKTLDRLTVKWYVAVKNPDKAGTFLLFSKEVEHVNIPVNEEVYTSVYLSPASIKRLTGQDKAGKNAVEFVGFEILVNGEKKAAETNKSQVGWWNTASDKISRSETVPLLNKKETPFGVMWWDRYAEVAEERR
ncbi:MAG TPA: Amuc_1102 family pilus-like protein, partial [Luteolibacter sp.]|nr:Amuc_1102 family pilus-like protein [Luteolibacter sp.]